MSLETVSPFEYVSQLMKLMADPGVLLTSVDQQGRPNVMTIGWCNLGIVWGKPVFIVYVRPSRFTYTNLDQTPEFVVNVISQEMSRAAAICGVKSGRTENKIKLAGLTPAPARKVSPPIIEGGLLYYECRIIHHNETDKETLNKDILKMYFPGGDLHRIYFGEIVECYGLPDVLQRI
jgi:flavin reductase (DIM6/NTAB) family NADH-FMN oxidoreductase RutF